MKYKISRGDLVIDVSLTVLCAISIFFIILAPLLGEVDYIDGVFAGVSFAVLVLFTIFSWCHDLKEAKE